LTNEILYAIFILILMRTNHFSKYFWPLSTESQGHRVSLVNCRRTTLVALLIELELKVYKLVTLQPDSTHQLVKQSIIVVKK